MSLLERLRVPPAPKAEPAPVPKPPHTCRDTTAERLTDLMLAGWRPILKPHIFGRPESQWIGWQVNAYPTDPRVKVAVGGMLMGEVHDNIPDALASTERRVKQYEELQA